jgi:hypothetical protein
MSEEASALLFRWSLAGALAAILLLNFLDRVVTYKPESAVRTSWINLIPKPNYHRQITKHDFDSLPLGSVGNLDQPKALCSHTGCSGSSKNSE